MSAAPRPQPRRERLTSLKDAGKNRPVGALTPRNSNSSSKSKKQGCCANPSPLDMDGTMVCENCGNLISESNIVSEVTFGETSGGAAMVEGGFVGNDQRHANTMGTAGRRIGLGGSEGKSTAESNGRDAIRGLMTSMRINNEHIEQSALGVYKLACSFNFVHGRRPATLAACCLYYACRMNPGNTQLLIDFAEKIKVNVFKLGDTYKALLEKLFIEEPGRKSMYGLLEPEPLIQKYVDKLEFGPVGGRKVADDAVKLLRRMRRDWMVDGRQPAGVCGACIILAARMNNFRRTVREVVYVVKVADMTINKRLIEFKRTQSGRLTVDQFRTHGERLVGEKEPPAVYFAREKEAKRRKLMQQANDLDAILQPRLDADGFAIPSLPASASASALPIDPNLLAASNLAHAELQAGEEANKPKKRGRPPKPKGPAPPVADEDIEVEQELEQEIDKILHDSVISDTINDIQFNEIAERSKRLADEIRGSHTTSESAVVEDTEFDDDPEVANCLLSPAEIEIKEKIWVTHNADWLRHEQAKKLKQALEEANGGPKKRVVRKRKQRQIGDLSDYNRDSPASTVGEAAQQMMQRRGKGFSRAINYEKLNAVMKPLSGGNNESSSESQPSSSRPSNAPSPAPSDASAMSVEEDDDDDHDTGLPTPAATQQTQQLQQRQGKNTVVVDDAVDDASEEEADDAQEEIDETVDSVAMYGLHDNGEFGGDEDEGIYAQEVWDG